MTSQPRCGTRALELKDMLQPLLIGADMRQHLYPLWTIRIYVDGSVPGDVIDQLRVKGCQAVTEEGGDVHGTLRRFLVADERRRRSEEFGIRLRPDPPRLPANDQSANIPLSIRPGTCQS
jgi:hypothetical protein